MTAAKTTRRRTTRKTAVVSVDRNNKHVVDNKKKNDITPTTNIIPSADSNPYLEARDRRIARNEERMKELGIFESANQRKKEAAAKRIKIAAARRKIFPKIRHATRRSSRGSKNVVLQMLTWNFGVTQPVVEIQDDGDERVTRSSSKSSMKTKGKILTFDTPPSRKSVRARGKNHRRLLLATSYNNNNNTKKQNNNKNKVDPPPPTANFEPLTKDQQDKVRRIVYAKKVNADSKEEHFLNAFQEYLIDHDKISDQNVRSVMRQIRKLTYGEGIRYDSPTYGWAPGKIYKKGIKIDVSHPNIPQLLIDAQHCENIWGRDHGNGWLLSHPLKKLYNFQQFLLQQQQK